MKRALLFERVADFGKLDDLTRLLEGLTFTDGEQGAEILLQGVDKDELLKQLQKENQNQKMMIEELMRENEELKRTRVAEPKNNAKVWILLLFFGFHCSNHIK